MLFFLLSQISRKVVGLLDFSYWSGDFQCGEGSGVYCQGGNTWETKRFMRDMVTQVHPTMDIRMVLHLLFGV